MGWANCTNGAGRAVGYAIEAECDHKDCDAQIDRGLAYVCGGMHDGGEHGCGGYFCYYHLVIGLCPDGQLCVECAAHAAIDDRVF